MPVKNVGLGLLENQYGGSIFSVLNARDQFYSYFAMLTNF